NSLGGYLSGMVSSLPRLYPLLGLCGGYALLMLFNPVRPAFGDGFRCIGRFKRIWLTFALLGFGYFIFQFATFTPIRNSADLDLNQVTSLPSWRWPTFIEIWRETPLPALEGVAGIFDNATTTYPLSVLAFASVGCAASGVGITANFCHRRCRGIHFRISVWRLYPGIFDHGLPGMGQRRQF